MSYHKRGSAAFLLVVVVECFQTWDGLNSFQGTIDDCWLVSPTFECLCDFVASHCEVLLLGAQASHTEELAEGDVVFAVSRVA